MSEPKHAKAFLDDPAVQAVLAAVRTAGPPTAFVSAGFVRNWFWDRLYQHPFGAFAAGDIDVVYFDPVRAEKSDDYGFESALSAHHPSARWQVRNQAHMHDFGGYDPFRSLSDGLEHWAETATTVSVRLRRDDSIEWFAPFGFEDLDAHILRITPITARDHAAGFWRRIDAKNWRKRWPDLEIIGP